MTDIVKSLSELLEPKILVENIYLFGILSVFLVMYGPRLHIAVPHSIHNLFENSLFRCVILFLIAYMAHRDFRAALTIAIIFLVTINILHTSHVLERINNKIQIEKFSAYGPPVAHCDVYAPTKEGYQYYPLNDSQEYEKSRDGNSGTIEYSATF